MRSASTCPGATRLVESGESSYFQLRVGASGMMRRWWLLWRSVWRPQCIFSKAVAREWVTALISFRHSCLRWASSWLVLLQGCRLCSSCRRLISFHRKRAPAVPSDYPRFARIRGASDDIALFPSCYRVLSATKAQPLEISSAGQAVPSSPSCKCGHQWCHSWYHPSCVSASDRKWPHLRIRISLLLRHTLGCSLPNTPKPRWRAPRNETLASITKPLLVPPTYLYFFHLKIHANKFILINYPIPEHNRWRCDIVIYLKRTEKDLRGQLVTIKSLSRIKTACYRYCKII